MAHRWFMPDSQVVSADLTLSPRRSGCDVGAVSVTAALAWLAVGAPIAWGVWVTLVKAAAPFG